MPPTTDTSAPPAPTKKRRRARRSSPRERADVRWIVVFAALAGAASGIEPTGLLVVDAGLGALVAAAVSWACSRSRPWTWVVLSAGAFAFAGPGWEWRLLGLLCLAGSVAVIVLEERTRVAGAAIGAVAAQVLLHLPDTVVHGGSAVLVIAFVAPTLVDGYRRARSKERRALRWTALGVGVFVVVAGLAFGAAAFLARTELEAGVEQARAGLDAARAGEHEQAQTLLVDAASKFESADSLLNGPLGLPARVIPVIGPNATATAALASSGHSLLDQAATTAQTVPYDDLRFAGGTIDIAQVERIREPLSASVAALEQAGADLADVENPWLLPVVREPLDDLQAEIAQALPDARTANGAAQVAPWLLGGDGARTYLVLLGQPAESRFGGGFVGTWAELNLSQGNVDLTESGTIEDLVDAPGAEGRTLTEAPAEYLERYGRYFPQYNLQNVTASPHFPHVRRVITELYPQTGGTPLSGAIYLDPAGVAALLALTGPVEVEGLDAPLEASNAEAILTSEIYELYPVAAERDEVLQGAIDAVFDALTSRDLPSPKEVSDALWPATQGGHLTFSVINPNAEGFLHEVGIDGSLPAIPEGGDFVALKTANAAPNKLDSYLERSLTYEVTVDPGTGQVTAQATITLTNTAPPDGLPEEVGTNRERVRGEQDAPPFATAIEYVSLYSPLTARTATLDDEPVAVEQQRELLRNVYSVPVRIAPGESRTLTFALAGRLTGPGYALVVDHQATVNDDQLDVRVTPSAGWSVASVEGAEVVEGDAVWSGAQTEDIEIAVEFAPPD